MTQFPQGLFFRFVFAAVGKKSVKPRTVCAYRHYPTEMQHGRGEQLEVSRDWPMRFSLREKSDPG